MLTREQLRTVRKIQIRTSHLVSDLFAGQYQSAFRGRGMEFAEVRLYQPGDDIRTIDWNVTARSGVPHVKRFAEERELTVMLLVDASASTLFGSVRETKRALATELAAVLAFSAITNNDKVGLLLFSDRIELALPPRKGTHHVLRVIRELLSARPAGRGTDVAGALEHLAHVSKRRCVVFVLSDFLDAPCRTALRMIETVQAQRDRWRRWGVEELRIGVGINTGPMIVGNIGSVERFEYTVLGDEVNIGARLEGVSKTRDGAVIISEATWRLVQDRIACDDLGTTTVPGREAPVRIFAARRLLD